MRNRVPIAGLVAVVSAALSSSAALGQTVTMNVSDALNSSSFNTAGHWFPNAAPSAGNNYEVLGNTTLRTPDSGSSYTFAGSSLTIGDGTTVSTMAFKSTASGTITINNLSLNNGAFSNAESNTVNFTLAGNGVTLLSGGGVIDADATGRIVSVAEALTGIGGLTINNSGGSGQGIINLTVADNYSGNTTVNDFALLDAQADGALGTGAVTVNNGGALELTGGTTNQYIASTSSLIVGTSGTVNLAYTGTDNINALSLNGGTSFVTGTWGSLTSTAQNKSSLFTGAGIINVGGTVATPEPASIWMVALIGLLPTALVVQRRPVAARVAIRP